MFSGEDGGKYKVRIRSKLVEVGGEVIVSSELDEAFCVLVSREDDPRPIRWPARPQSGGTSDRWADGRHPGFNRDPERRLPRSWQPARCSLRDVLKPCSSQGPSYCTSPPHPTPHLHHSCRFGRPTPTGPLPLGGPAAPQNMHRDNVVGSTTRWALRDSNPRPARCKRDALAN